MVPSNDHWSDFISIIVYKMCCDIYKRFSEMFMCIKVRYVIYAKYEPYEFVTTMYWLYLKTIFGTCL